MTQVLGAGSDISSTGLDWWFLLVKESRHRSAVFFETDLFGNDISMMSLHHELGKFFISRHKHILWPFTGSYIRVSTYVQQSIITRADFFSLGHSTSFRPRNDIVGQAKIWKNSPRPRVFLNWPQNFEWRFEGPTMFKNCPRFDHLTHLAT